MARTCVILQPTFMPWIGWFDLVDQADMTVILDDVGFSKQSWQQRNRIRTPAGLEFLTVPVKSSGRLGQRIIDCELANQLFAEKMLKSVRLNYSKAAHFSSYFPGFEVALLQGAATERLADLNIALISWLAGVMGVGTPMVRSSSLGVGGERGEHVAAICETLDATRYLSPAGAEEYLSEDRSSFDRRGIAVLLHVFEHPQYPQRFRPFIPFASAVDLVFNVGSAAGDLMRSGRRPPRQLGEQRDIASVYEYSQ